MVCGHCIKVIVTMKKIIEVATQAHSFCFVKRMHSKEIL